jgi:hypothetical protein
MYFKILYKYKFLIFHDKEENEIKRKQLINDFETRILRLVVALTISLCTM